MDENILFCNALLATARKEQEKAKLKIGKLTTWSDDHSDYWEVWEDGVSGQVWMGSAHCASEAKYNYLVKRLDALAIEAVT